MGEDPITATSMEARMDQFVALISEGIKNSASTVSMRYVDLATQLACLNERSGRYMLPILTLILDQFFTDDVLVKITLLDFIVLLCKRA